MREVRGSYRRIQTVLLNFGPQHPAAHGILRIGLALHGEVITRAELQFGLLHRGSEKLCEARPYALGVPYMDRMDYVANFMQEHAAVLGIEGLADRYPSWVVLVLRSLFDEVARVLNHLLTLSAVCLDMGAMGPIFWAFEEREVLMEVVERCSGARMHTAMYRPWGISLQGGTSDVVGGVVAALRRLMRVVAGAFLGLVTNRTLRSRCVYLGCFTRRRCVAYGIRGVIARASGLFTDLRLGVGGAPYAAYGVGVCVQSFSGKRGDVYDRLLLRIREIISSMQQVLECVSLLGSLDGQGVSLGTRHSAYVSSHVAMESVIGHFKTSCGQLSTPVKRGVLAGYVEGPKGDVGVLLVSGGGSAPYR